MLRRTASIATWMLGRERQSVTLNLARILTLKLITEDTALIWEQDEPGLASHISYQELHDQVAKLSNAYKRMGLKKGDIVTIYMPMVPHALYAMLACARIGAVHSVVFAGFSAEALAQRMTDAKSRHLITADQGLPKPDLRPEPSHHHGPNHFDGP